MNFWYSANEWQNFWDEGRREVKKSKWCYRCSSVLLGAALLTLFHGSKAASASILSSLDFNRLVYAEYTTNPTSFSVQPYQSTAVPLQQTLSADDGQGGRITTSYSVTDNGTQATIDITSSGSVTANNAISEGDGQGITTSFNLSMPVFYDATISTTGSASGGTLDLTEEGSLGLVGSGYGYYFHTDTSVLTPQTFTGTAYPGLVDLSESWGMAIDGPNPPAYGLGTDTVTVVFTAIPEPSSVTLIGIPAATLLICRRRLWC
jgi:hypothetical protein